MNTINVGSLKYPIQNKDYIEVCDNFKKRIFKILYLKEDMLAGLIKEYDAKSYITALTWDIYGAYIMFDNYKFLNCICELEGIKDNLDNEFVRKKVLDLGSFISNISCKE